MEKGEVILYQPNETIKLEVRLEEESVWLTRNQLALLFDRDVKTIGKHVNKALKEELNGFPVVAKFATTANDGKRYNTEHYNLDMILSVGYRVKSNRGIQFRKWSNKVLKEHLLKGYSINHRLQTLEQTVAEHSQKIDFFVRTALPPMEGIFYDGQIFDAYKFATDLIKSANQSLILIDNYVNETTLLMLSKRKEGVSATIYTQRISSQLQLDLEKHNAQYSAIDVKMYKRSHDRFLLIDGQEVYHIGASLKDLGKKMFAFSRLNESAEMILQLLSVD